MLRFILRKMLSKRWMVLALLAGNILLVAITCSNAMYGQAVLQRTLTRSLEDYLSETNKYPGLAVIQQSAGYGLKNNALEEAASTSLRMAEDFDLPLIERVEYYSTGPSLAEDALQRKDGIPDRLSLSSMSGLKEHAEIVAGEMYSDAPAQDGTVDVLISERGMRSMNLLLDERITFPKYLLATGEPLTVRICGVFRNRSDEDPYWVRTPGSFTQECVMPENIFRELFMENEAVGTLQAQFYVLMDYTQMRGDRAGRLRDTALAYEEKFSRENGLGYRDNFSEILDEFLKTEKKVNVTLWVLQVPIFVLLAAFIFMVSKEMLQMEQNEIAVIKSRGASRRQIILTYLLQSLIIALIALAAGIPLGIYLVQVLGSANAFLEFVHRSFLPAEFSARALLFSLAAALLSTAAMVLPLLRRSNVTIVNHKQKKHQKSGAPLWRKMYLDVAVLAVALYGLYTYNGQKEFLAQRVGEGVSPDPLLFVSSSLFMIGAGLVALRIIPVLIYIVFRLFSKWWSPALYAAFLRVIRTRYSQSFIMVFLMMTITMGIFNAQTARTINSNEEDNIAYGTGADLVIQEKWKDNSETLAMQAGSDSVSVGREDEVVYEEPDYSVYRDLPGVKSSTKVLTDKKASLSSPEGELKNIYLMGIHTKTFGETAWFKDGLLPYHFYEYLNALASDARGILLSANYRENFGCRLGDVVTFRNGNGDSLRGVVYGFVDYWPTYARYSYQKDSDGTYKQKENYLVVANLALLQANWGITPYQIWIDAQDSTSFIYEYAEEHNVRFSVFEDTSEKIIALKNDPVFQGTNGILTVSFIVVLLLCAVGFLIYWILSIRSRALQFGIYRAMGMSMREIVSMLLCEQLLISGTSIGTGVGVGILTSRLYMPFIQMAYAAYDSALPLSTVSYPGDMLRLGIVVGLMILVCMAVLGGLISRMKIAQVLKLGED